MPFKPDFVCTNPNCASYGSAHYNCKCSEPGNYADGGIVHHCSSDKAHQGACEYFADDGEIQSNKEFINDPGLAIDHAVANHGLLHTLSKTGFTKSEEPGRVHTELLDSHRRGRKSIHSHTHSVLDPKAPPYKADSAKAEALGSKLDELKADPDRALNIGGNLGDSAPMHHAMLAAKAGAAMSYLESIKPKPTPGGPLDPVLVPSKNIEKLYQRQVALVEDPKLIFERVRNGEAIPQDFETLAAVYPKLRKSIQDKAFEALADAKAHGKNLTYKEKRHLGALLGEPVTLQQTPQVIQAIMHANAPAQPPQPAGKTPKKATGVELKQINKVNALYQTPLERLQTSRNS